MPPCQTKYNLSKPQLHNHYLIQVQYHPADDEVQDEFRVVGVIVFGLSRKYAANDIANINCKEAKDPVILTWDEPSEVTYTYDVRWTVRPVFTLHLGAFVLRARKLTLAARCADAADGNGAVASTRPSNGALAGTTTCTCTTPRSIGSGTCTALA